MNRFSTFLPQGSKLVNEYVFNKVYYIKNILSLAITSEIVKMNQRSPDSLKAQINLNNAVSERFKQHIYYVNIIQAT